MGKGTRAKIKKAAKSPEQIRRERVHAKAQELGVPANQIKHGLHAVIDVPRLDKGVKVSTTQTLVNHGGTPVARWKAAKLLSESQIAAIEHCEGLWARLNGKSLVMNYGGVSGRSASVNQGWSEQEALDDLKRIKGYFTPKWWSLFESVCRFDEPAGFAGSRITNCRNDQVAAARTTVQFVADIIATKERLSY